MLKVTLKNGNEYELLEDTTVYPSGSPNARSRMEIHMGEDAMTTAEFEAAFMDEAATAKIRLTKTTDEDNTKIVFDTVYQHYCLVASIGKKRVSKRDLPQALAAQGLTGGMSESALAGMYNSYGNNRNTIDRGRNESLAALLDTLNSNRSSALQSYNSQLSAAEQQKMAYQMQLEQALANGSAEILQNKYDTLQNLDNAYAQQILALQQAAAQAAQKRW